MSDRSCDITGITVRTAEDTVGIVVDPGTVRLDSDDGWTLEELEDQFQSDVTEGLTLDRTGAFETDKPRSE